MKSPEDLFGLSCAGADLVTSLDAQFLQPRIGFAADFRQKVFATSDYDKKFILVRTHLYHDTLL